MDSELSSSTERPHILSVVLAFMLAVGAFLGGMSLQSYAAETEQLAGIFSIFAPKAIQVAENPVDMTEFWKVWNLLDQHYIAASSTKTISNEEKLYGAIKGLVSSYEDPYTVFLPPEESNAFAQDIAGNFGGIGMEVGSRDGVLTVIAPLKNTPAEAAGLLAGDYILKIDGVETDDMVVDQAVSVIRGEKGTAVTLTIFREGELEPRDVAIVRDTITIPTVETEVIDDVMIVSLYSFNAVSEQKMREAMEEFSRSAATKMILDLRGNPGGYLQSAVAIASFFLPPGKIVVRERHGEDGQDRLLRSTGRIVGSKLPTAMVVLIDNGSASASEILAGALKEHGVASLIGVNTFGKGSVQELLSLPDGSSLKVTVARWLTPNEVSISDGGLAPDYEVVRTPEERLKGVDPQREAALLVIHGKPIVSASSTSPIE